MLIEINPNCLENVIFNIIKKDVCSMCGECDPHHILRCESGYKRQSMAIVNQLLKQRVKKNAE